MLDLNMSEKISKVINELSNVSNDVKTTVKINYKEGVQPFLFALYDITPSRIVWNSIESHVSIFDGYDTFSGDIAKFLYKIYDVRNIDTNYFSKSLIDSTASAIGGIIFKARCAGESEITIPVKEYEGIESISFDCQRIVTKETINHLSESLPAIITSMFGEHEENDKLIDELKETVLSKDKTIPQVEYLFVDYEIDGNIGLNLSILGSILDRYSANKNLSAYMNLLKTIFDSKLPELDTLQEIAEALSNNPSKSIDKDTYSRKYDIVYSTLRSNGIFTLLNTETGVDPSIISNNVRFEVPLKSIREKL